MARVVRSALSELIASTGVDPTDPHALTQRWGVNKALSWKISKVIQTDDPFLALQQLPRKSGIEILLKSAEKVGVEPGVVRATHDAIEQFEQFVRQHCDDRNTFDMMGSDVSPSGRQQREENHRKQLFQGASYVWGVQARAYLNLRVVAPNADDRNLADVANLAAHLDFRRLRENVRWAMSRRVTNHDDGSPITLENFEPMDPESAGQVVPLMPRFCSTPVPALNVIRRGNRATVELVAGPVGNAGLISYVVGGIERRLPHARTPQDEFFDLWTISTTPAEVLIFDVFIHESFASTLPPKPMLASLLGPLSPGYADHEDYQLPLYEPLMDLGVVSLPPPTPEVPRYGEMVRAVFERTGWSPGQFRGFRVKIAYPPIPAALIMRCGLPEPVTP